ncbi:hypothetical protein ES703_72893 [subsurface metagenome]
MLGVNWIDWLVIAGYLVGITIIGIWEFCVKVTVSETNVKGLFG